MNSSAPFLKRVGIKIVRPAPNIIATTAGRRDFKMPCISDMLISFILLFSLIFGIPVYSFAKIPFFQDPDAIQNAAESVLMLTCYDENGNEIASGSGFLAFEDGVIVTNYHVVSGGVASIIAGTEDGLYFNIDEVLFLDPVSDIAILKTKAKTRLDLLKLGEVESLKKGSRVVAIGSPLGLLNTVSEGIYSGIIYDETDYILFSASISHGSSGGALFNEDGEVIGVTSASYEAGQNLNFAVPIENVITLWNTYLLNPSSYSPDELLLLADSSDIPVYNVNTFETPFFVAKVVDELDLVDKEIYLEGYVIEYVDETDVFPLIRIADAPETVTEYFRLLKEEDTQLSRNVIFIYLPNREDLLKTGVKPYNHILAKGKFTHNSSPGFPYSSFHFACESVEIIQD